MMQIVHALTPPSLFFSVKTSKSFCNITTNIIQNKTRTSTYTSCTTTATTNSACFNLTRTITSLLAACAVLATPSPTIATAVQGPPEEVETLENIPQVLSGDCNTPEANGCKKPRIQKPKSRKAESCTIKCVTTCIRGGEGSPGEGPFNIRRPLVVFKPGFRSRKYCLVECSDICNLIGDRADDWP